MSNFNFIEQNMMNELKEGSILQTHNNSFLILKEKDDMYCVLDMKTDTIIQNYTTSKEKLSAFIFIVIDFFHENIINHIPSGWKILSLNKKEDNKNIIGTVFSRNKTEEELTIDPFYKLLSQQDKEKFKTIVFQIVQYKEECYCYNLDNFMLKQISSEQIQEIFSSDEYEVFNNEFFILYNERSKSSPFSLFGI